MQSNALPVSSTFSRIAFGLLVLISAAAAFWPETKMAATGEPVHPGDLAWMLTASAFVLIMTPGLSFFYGGLVRPNSIISTMLQSFVALGVISVLWYVVGFSLAFGDSLGGFIGDPRTFFMFQGVGRATHPEIGSSIPLVLFAAFQLKFAIITPALITGSFAERVSFRAYLLFMIFFSLFIYCPLAHWTWHPEGFLGQWGVLDYAGGTVVHISAGFAALAGALYLGRREAHVRREQHQAINVPYVILGTGLLWFGWFGFNAGSALSASTEAVDAFVTTNLASASAMLAWILFDMVKGQKPGAIGACIGAVVGLVAITPAAGFVEYGPAIFIGVIASLVSNYVVTVKERTTIDDTLDVFPCHGVGGIVGMLLTAVFAREVGLVYGETETFLYHLLALGIVSAFTFGGSWLLYGLTQMLTPLRVSRAEEQMGLDVSQHEESVYEVLEEAAQHDNGQAVTTS